MARLILDTGPLLANARGELDLSAITAEDDIAIPAVVIAEYLVGLLAMTNMVRRAEHRAFLDALIARTPIVDYGLAVAEHHAALLDHTRRTGRPRGAHDLIIAACARSTGRTILTGDGRARFDELPGVEALVVTL